MSGQSEEKEENTQEIEDIVKEQAETEETGEWEESNLNVAKRERKEVESQYNKIKNRINLLESHDNKALKNMRLTKEKAKNLKDIKIRNKMHENYKNDVKDYEKMIVQRKNQYARQVYLSQKETVATNKEVMASIAQSQAWEMKQEKEENRRIVSQEEEQLMDGKVKVAQLIKSQKKDSRFKMKETWERRVASSRKAHQEQIQQEVSSKTDYKKALKTLEKQENEMINRLQSTNTQQQKAIQEFENVCSMKITDEIVNDSIRSKSRSKSKSYSQQKSRYLLPRREKVSAFDQ